MAAAKQTRTEPQGSKRLPARTRDHKLTLMDRVHRARQVTALRARVPPVTWPKIAKEVGLSMRQCQDLYADVLRWDETREDPMRVVDETIDTLTALLTCASECAAEAKMGTPGQVGALKLAMDAVTVRLAVMQAAGYVPRNLASPLEQSDMRALFQEMADVLRRNEVPEQVLLDFMALARSHLGVGPVVEGRELPAAA